MEVMGLRLSWFAFDHFYHLNTTNTTTVTSTQNSTIIAYFIVFLQILLTYRSNFTIHQFRKKLLKGLISSSKLLNLKIKVFSLKNVSNN